MKKMLLLLLVCILALSVFVGCTPKSSDGETSNASSGDKKLQIVYVTPLLAHPVWLMAKEGFEDAAEAYGFEGYWRGPIDIDANEMIKQLEIAISEGVDGVITQGMNPQAMIPVMNKLKEAGIPVVITDSDIPDAEKLAYIGYDPEMTGKVGAQAIYDSLGDKNTPLKIAIMTPAIDYEIGKIQIESYERNLKALGLTYEIVEIVESKSDMLTATKRYEDLFSTYPDINVCINLGAEAGPAAAKVVEEKDLVGKVTIIAIDDLEETLEYIRKGTIYATVTGSFYRQGYQPAKWLIEFINEGKKPAQVYNDAGTMAVTAENVDSYKEIMNDTSKW